MKEREELIEEHKSLVRWKSSISKVGIAVLSSIGVVMTWAISKYFSQ